MSFYRSITLSVFVAVLFAISAFSQDNSEKWLRVLTEDGSIIDVERSSLDLEQEQVIRAQFRTKLSAPEAVPGKPGSKYQTRFDLIQFTVDKRRYRIVQSRLLDAAGKEVFAFWSNDEAGSKPLTGRTANRLFSAASQLAPFGGWRVLTYRYASGEPASEQDPSELRSLIHSEVVFELGRMVVGKQSCNSPVYSPKTVTNEDFAKRIGSSLESLGLPADKIDTIRVGCTDKKDFPPQSIILRLSRSRALLLWEGVLLELERPGNPFLP